MGLFNKPNLFSLGIDKIKPASVGHPEDAYRLLDSYKDLDREMLLVMHIMPDLRVHYVQRSGIGSSQSVCFDTSDVFREAILHKSKGIILAHNHPFDDNPHPTQDDIRVTRRMCIVGDEARIPLLDHIVFGHSKFHSMFEHGHGIFAKRPVYILDLEAIKTQRPDKISGKRRGRTPNISNTQIFKQLSKISSDIVLHCCSRSR